MILFLRCKKINQINTQINNLIKIMINANEYCKYTNFKFASGKDVFDRLLIVTLNNYHTKASDENIEEMMYD